MFLCQRENKFFSVETMFGLSLDEKNCRPALEKSDKGFLKIGQRQFFYQTALAEQSDSSVLAASKSAQNYRYSDEILSTKRKSFIGRAKKYFQRSEKVHSFTTFSQSFCSLCVFYLTLHVNACVHMCACVCELLIIK